jgi:hypothetical protein
MVYGKLRSRPQSDRPGSWHAGILAAAAVTTVSDKSTKNQVATAREWRNDIDGRDIFDDQEERVCSR